MKRNIIIYWEVESSDETRNAPPRTNPFAFKYAIRRSALPFTSLRARTPALVAHSNLLVAAQALPLFLTAGSLGEVTARERAVIRLHRERKQQRRLGFPLIFLRK